jgi:hypothetical protein
VGTTTVNDLNGNIETTTYNYSGGYFWVGGPQDKKFAGFKSVTETRNDRIATTYFSQGNANHSSLGEQNDQFALIGKPFRTDTMTATSTVLKRTWYRYNVQAQSGNRFLQTLFTITQSFDGAGNYRAGAQHSDVDASGNVSTSIDYGEVTLADAVASSYSDTGSDLIRTHFEWATTTATSTNPSAPTNHPSREIVTNYSGTQIAETKHVYDGLATGLLTKGNETATRRWQSGSSYATTARVFNSYGLATSLIDARGSTTTIVYDSSNLYPATTTNPLGHIESKLFNLRCGSPTQIVDANGATTTIAYDGLCRTTRKDGTSTSTLNKTETTAYTDTSGAVSVLTTKWTTDVDGIAKYEYKDGLGRVIQSRSQAEDSQWVTQDTVYDTHGRILQQSLPYFAAISTRGASSTTASLYTTYTYDALDRPLAAQTSVGTTNYSYGTWTSTVTDGNGKSRDFTNDDRGNLTHSRAQRDFFVHDELLIRRAQQPDEYHRRSR